MLLCFYSTGSGLLKTPTLQQTFGLAVKMPLEALASHIQVQSLNPNITVDPWHLQDLGWVTSFPFLAQGRGHSGPWTNRGEFILILIHFLSLSLKTENSYSDLIAPNPLMTPLCLEDEGGAYSFLLYFSLLPLRSSGLRPQGILLILYVMLQYATSLSIWKAHLLLRTQCLFQIALLL